MKWNSTFWNSFITKFVTIFHKWVWKHNWIISEFKFCLFCIKGKRQFLKRLREDINFFLQTNFQQWTLKHYSSRDLTSGRSNGERNGRLEGYTARQCNFEDPQRRGNSKWLTNGPITTETITSRCCLTTICVSSVISSRQFLRWKFRDMKAE